MKPNTNYNIEGDIFEFIRSEGPFHFMKPIELHNEYMYRTPDGLIPFKADYLDRVAVELLLEIESELSDIPLVMPEYRSLDYGDGQLCDHTHNRSVAIDKIEDVGPFLNSKGIKIDAVTVVNGLPVFLTKDLITKII